MDTKLKKKWIKALRSGKYQQTSGSLYDGEGYCCLGVLCEIQGINWSKAAAGEFDLGTTDLPRGYNAGLKPNTRAILGTMNDGSSWDNIESKTFKEIADYIEERFV